MILQFKAALSNSEKQRKVMLVNSDLENFPQGENCMLRLCERGDNETIIMKEYRL